MLAVSNNSIKHQSIAKYTVKWSNSSISNNSVKPYSPNLQHSWSLTSRLFSVIFRTLIGGVLPLCREAVNVFCCPNWLGLKIWYYIYIYIYIYILSSTYRPVLFYQNSSVWLDRLDSRTWDWNLADWNANPRFYHSATRKPVQVKEI